MFISMTDGDVIAKLVLACREAGTQRAWARANGVSEQYLNDVLNGRRGPGQSILAALGLVKRPAEYEDAPKLRRKSA